jgi:ADP-ribosylation factor GTPase-activating protein 1
MDAWNPDQLKRMQLGGNAKLNGFLQQYGVPKATDTKDKYNGKPAEFYREKIRAEVDGRRYSAPPPSEVRAAIPRPKSYAGSRTQNADWDDWGAGGEGGGGGGSHSGGGGGGGGNGAPTSNEYSMSQLQASAGAKEDFFARRMAENASKPDHLPPNQGGKYVGFGSQPAGGAPLGRRPGAAAGPGVDDVSEMLSKGMSGLSTFAGQAALAARERAAQANEALRDAGVADLGQASALAAEKTKEYGAKGWSLLKTAYAAAASTIETTAAQQGYKVDLGSRKVADSAGNTRPGNYAPVGSSLAPGGVDPDDGGWNSGGFGSRVQSSDQRLGGDVGGPLGGGGASGGEWGGGGGGWGGEAAEKPRAPAPRQQQPRTSGGADRQADGEWTGWEGGGDSPATAKPPADDAWGQW